MKKIVLHVRCNAPFLFHPLSEKCFDSAFVKISLVIDKGISLETFIFFRISILCSVNRFTKRPIKNESTEMGTQIEKFALERFKTKQNKQEIRE